MGFKILFALSFVAVLLLGGECIQYKISNNCPTTIWPATQTSRFPELSTSGFELPAGASQIVEGDQQWVGRIWARTRCTNKDGYFSCRTGDCGRGSIACNGSAPAQPVTTVELSIGANDGIDLYHISAINGFNIPVRVAPRTGCPKITCYPNACPAGTRYPCPSGQNYVITFCPLNN